MFGWKSGLTHGFHEACSFYAIVIAATGTGTLMSEFDVGPIKALIWSAIVNEASRCPSWS